MIVVAIVINKLAQFKNTPPRQSCSLAVTSVQAKQVGMDNHQRYPRPKQTIKCWLSTGATSTVGISTMAAASNNASGRNNILSTIVQRLPRTKSLADFRARLGVIYRPTSQCKVPLWTTPASRKLRSAKPALKALPRSAGTN